MLSKCIHTFYLWRTKYAFLLWKLRRTNSSFCPLRAHCLMWKQVIYGSISSMVVSKEALGALIWAYCLSLEPCLVSQHLLFCLYSIPSLFLRNTVSASYWVIPFTLCIRFVRNIYQFLFVCCLFCLVWSRGKMYILGKQANLWLKI